jgi:small-conductance mechanosensitive channel
MATADPSRLERHQDCPRLGLARLAVTAVFGNLLALGCLAPTALAAPAQEPKPAVEQAAPAPPTPVAIPPAEMAEAAEEANGTIQKAGAMLASPARIADIEAKASRRLASVDKDAAAAMVAAQAERSPQALSDLDFSWTRRRQDLRVWIRTLTERAKTLDKQIDLLKDLEATWRRTLEQAAAERMPATVLERAHAIVKESGDLQRELKDRRSAVLSMQGRLGTADDRVTAVLERIAEARANIRGRLLERDRPPLWAALSEARTARAVVASIRQGLERERGTLVAYIVDDGEQVLGALVIQVFILLASLYAVLALRRRVARQQEHDRIVRPYEALFAHPFAAAVLIALLPTLRVHPYAPSIIREIYGFALLIPLLVLLPALLGSELRRALFIFAAFYLVDRVKFLVHDAPLVERLPLLLETLVAIPLLAWFARPEEREQRPESRPWVVARTLIARVAVVALLVSLVANVLGYFTLAKVIGEGILNSAYLGLLLYAGVSVLTLVVAALVQSRTARRSRVIGANAAAIERRTNRLIGWIAVLAWVVSTLDLFTIRGPVVDTLTDILTSPASLGSLSFSLGDIASFVVVLWAAVWIARIIRTVLDDEVFPRARLGRGIPAAISTTVQYSVLLLGFLFALGAAGFDLSKVTLLAGAFGIGIGFGLQNVVNNFTSGLVLLFERPIQVGDAVQVGDVFGEIRRIGMRSSTLRTFQGAEVIVPNADLISNQVINWTLSDRQRRIELPVGVAYGTDPEQVIRLLVEAAKRHPGVLAYPEPDALFTGFGESSLDFELRAWTAQFETFLRIKSDLAIGINKALRDAGIEIPFPQRELHVRSTDADAPRSLSNDRRPAPDSTPRGEADPREPLAGPDPPPRSFERN